MSSSHRHRHRQCHRHHHRHRHRQRHGHHHRHRQADLLYFVDWQNLQCFFAAIHTENKADFELGIFIIKIFDCLCSITFVIFAMRVFATRCLLQCEEDGNADRPSANNPCSDRRIDSSQWERYGGTHYYTSERGVARGYLGGTVRYSGGV